MSLPQVTQSALIVALAVPAQPPVITQTALISVQAPPSINPQITQSALILAIANAESFLNLSNVIGLNCWSPCDNYGTQAEVIITGDCK